MADPFAGSGSTGVGCALEGYRFIGCEIECHHAAVAIERIAAAHGEFVSTAAQQAVLALGGAT